MNKIIENKKLYSNLKKLSQEFYKSKESEDKKEEYEKSYKEHLETIEKNKKDIIELNNNINILQTKLTLYTSEVYIIYPYSSLEIINLSLDEAKKYEELSKSSMKEVTATPAKRVIVSKKGGHLYDLEYLEIPETFTESVESNFAKIKKEIKKKSKKLDKIEILSKYDLN